MGDRHGMDKRYCKRHGGTTTVLDKPLGELAEVELICIVHYHSNFGYDVDDGRYVIEKWKREGYGDINLRSSFSRSLLL